MQSPFLKEDKQVKPEKPGKFEKPDASKDKPFSIPAVPLEFMPPAANHPNRLVSVTGSDGAVLCLSFSDGIEWRTLKFETTVPLPVPDQPEQPETPPVPTV